MRAPSVPAVLATLALALAALAALTPAASAAEVPLDVLLHEVEAAGGRVQYHILPPDIYAKTGDVLRLNVVNYGASPHDLLVCGEAPKVPATCSNVLGRTRSLATNESETLVIELEEPGEFEYFGTGFGEKAAQMKGLLHVTGEAKSKDAPAGPLLPLAALALAAFAAVRIFPRRGP